MEQHAQPFLPSQIGHGYAYSPTEHSLDNTSLLQDSPEYRQLRKKYKSTKVTVKHKLFATKQELKQLPGLSWKPN